MKIIIEDTIHQYKHLYNTASNEEDYFRYSMMKPFESMWQTIQVPLKAKQTNGYDVLTATKMLGYLDIHEKDIGRGILNLFKAHELNQIAEKTLNHCLTFIEQQDLNIKANELRFGLYMADSHKLKLQKGYTGFGGIPGYIQVILHPNSYNIPRLPAVIAHEFHHNVRFSYFNWDHGNVTVGDYLIIEGLAESFAKELYGEELLGPWVTSFDKDDLSYSIEVLQDALQIKGFAEVSSYMFGDDFSREQGYQPVGLSPFAGYAIGYHVVQTFLKRTKMSILEATLLDSEEILQGSGVFHTWA